MKYYLLTVTLRSGKAITGIRELEEENIDLLYTVYELKARKAYGSQMAEFNIARVSKNCKPVQAYLKKMADRLPNDIDPSLQARRFG